MRSTSNKPAARDHSIDEVLIELERMTSTTEDTHAPEQTLGELEGHLLHLLFLTGETE